MSMRLILAFSLVSVGFGCTPTVTPDPQSKTAVDALLAACEPMYCEGAEAAAEKVISAGRGALPALRKAWEVTTDPDVIIWTKACMECIEKEWALPQYKTWLRETMRSGEREQVKFRSATHLSVLSNFSGFMRQVC